MRGPDEKQGEVFSYLPLEDRIPRDHPLRRIRPMVDRGLQEMWSHFEALYARRGRPSIAPERLLEALLLQAGEHDLLSEEHFTVDGTLIQAWASRNSFVPKEKPPQKGSGSKGKKLLRDTHESNSDPEARLYKKSAAGQSQPSYLGHVLMENRNGLVTAALATQSSTSAEREAALAMLDQRGRSPGQVNEQTRLITLGADKLYQEKEFITGLRERRVIPHVAEYEPNPHWPNWLSEQERQDPGYAISQRKRKLIEK